jgi:NifU-like protein involved in Fe-S cluster formation
MAEENWVYSDTVKDHFFDPRNVQNETDEKKIKADGFGEVGAMACGDVMKMWIKVKNDKIIDCKWRTFGCASAIASTSMLSVMVLEDGGMKISDAYLIRPDEILARLDGLPKHKIHCSVLGDQALRAAIDDYQSGV